MKLLSTLSSVVILLLSAPAMSEPAPVQFSSLNGFNAPANDSVAGLRFPALYGKTSTVKGVDLHLLAIGETDDFTGLQFPLLLAGANHINNSMTGVAVGVWNWNKGQATGVNFAAVNITKDVKGANLGLVNVSKGYTVFDFSAANISQKSDVQLGFFNMTEQIDGVQIGLLNCAKDGFLPCFPLINF